MSTPSSSSSFAFEVFCNSCRVSLPAGTRRCLHCGGPTNAERGTTRSMFRARETLGLPPLPPLEDLGVEEPGQPRARFGLSFSSLVWLLFLVGFSVYRSCAG